MSSTKTILTFQSKLHAQRQTTVQITSQNTSHVADIISYY